MTQFKNRLDAGRQLTSEISKRLSGATVVLAITPGGVGIGHELALGVRAPLDVFLVHKVVAPGHEEMAIGCVTSRGARLLNADAIANLGLSERTVKRVVSEQEALLRDMERELRASRPALDLRGRTVVLVDDGALTSTCMRAAVQAVRRTGPKAIIIALPVASADTCRQLRTVADEVVCAYVPARLLQISECFGELPEMTAAEVSSLLGQNAHLAPRAEVAQLHWVEQVNAETASGRNLA